MHIGEKSNNNRKVYDAENNAINPFHDKSILAIDDILNSAYK